MVVSRHPLIRAESTDTERRAYRDWALRVTDSVGSALTAVHDAGYSHGDLHPGNVIVADDDSVVLLDFEMARPLAEHAPAIIGAPGFVPRDLRGGETLDRYAYACIRLFVFVPFTPLLGMDGSKADDLLTWVCAAFDLDDAWRESIVRDLALPAASEGGVTSSRAMAQWRGGEPHAIDRVIDEIARALVADATLDREDRAWPGDPAQFREPAAALAHGASGVLLALTAAGVEVPPDVWNWFDAAVDRERDSPTTPAGLYDGRAGLAWTLRRFGRDAAADRAIDVLRRRPLDGFGSDLYSGLAGVGLLLLSEESETLTPLVHDIATELARRFAARTPRPRVAVATGRGGLLRGPSGVALFASRLFAVSREWRHLRLAEAAVDDDLAACVWAPDGSLQIDEGWRTMPYLASGSAGIGYVLAELIPHSEHHARYAHSLEGVVRAATPPLIVQPGLFDGRAGLIHTLVSLTRAGHGSDEIDRALDAHVSALRLHAVRRRTGIGIPGNALLRLSCDLATGAAGVLTALVAYRDLREGSDAPRQVLPFLDTPRSVHPQLSLATAADTARR